MQRYSVECNTAPYIITLEGRRWGGREGEGEGEREGGRERENVERISLNTTHCLYISVSVSRTLQGWREPIGEGGAGGASVEEYKEQWGWSVHVQGSLRPFSLPLVLSSALSPLRSLMVLHAGGSSGLAWHGMAWPPSLPRPSWLEAGYSPPLPPPHPPQMKWPPADGGSPQGGGAGRWAPSDCYITCAIRRAHV